ncbi:hypothetical protein XarjCFBP1022_11340 [Xanthomonas arboricola]|nr:hypothetical protein XarjCFBP1022_11340 [Xanthomonas arboricola]
MIPERGGFRCGGLRYGAVIQAIQTTSASAALQRLPIKEDTIANVLATVVAELFEADLMLRAEPE